MSFIKICINIFAVLVLLNLAAADHHDKEWGYPNLDSGEEFENWGGNCETGRMQSPIDLRLEGSLKGIYEHFEFNNYDEDQEGVTIVNNGHTVKLSNFSRPMTLKNGPLEDEFMVEQIHLHWWSEHTIENIRYPLEVHIVHRNTKYPDFNTAAGQKDGVTVLAVLYHFSREKNKGIDQIVENVARIQNYTEMGRRVVMEDSFKVEDLLPSITGYFTYPGSLTTPSCAEVVTWIVLHKTFPVSKEQVEQFKQLQIGENEFLKNNYRPIQNSNNRPVISVQYSESSGATLPVSVPLLLLLLSGLFSRYLLL